MEDDITTMIQESMQVKQALLGQTGIIRQIAEAMAEAIRNGHKIMLCGNGGSSADAQHVAAEFVGRFLRERAAWPAMALTTNQAILTALGNDYGYETVFARQVEAFARPGDIVVGISTSGNASNVLQALAVARERGCTTIGFTGQKGSRLKEVSDYCLMAPSASTPRIQEAHILVWHIICELVERGLTEDQA